MKVKMVIATLIVYGSSWVRPLGAQQAKVVPAANQNQQAHAAGKHKGAANRDDEGQRIFAANCSRCHETPEAFPDTVSNTVLRHMRVRANLSAHDEKELRRFFHP